MITIADLKRHLESYLGDKVYVRVGDKRHRILSLNTLVAAGEVEIECAEDD